MPWRPKERVFSRCLAVCSSLSTTTSGSTINGSSSGIYVFIESSIARTCCEQIHNYLASTRLSPTLFDNSGKRRLEDFKESRCLFCHWSGRSAKSHTETMRSRTRLANRCLIATVPELRAMAFLLAPTLDPPAAQEKCKE